MGAAAYDFTIEQGATLILPFVWKDSAGVPINLTGYTARMQIRASKTSTAVLLSATTADNTLQITAADGKVTIVLPEATTAAITWRRGVYDLELVSAGGVVTRLVEGAVAVSREVTRA